MKKRGFDDRLSAQAEVLRPDLQGQLSCQKLDHWRIAAAENSGVLLEPDSAETPLLLNLSEFLGRAFTFTPTVL